MKKPRKKHQKKKKVIHNGYIAFVILVVAVLGFILAGGFSSFSKLPLTATYMPITPTPGPTSSAMQLQTLQFASITYTPTPTKAPPNTNGGGNNSGGSTGNSVADYAIKLLHAILQVCGSPVTHNNADCLYKMEPGIISRVVDILHRSAVKDSNLQCVGFAEAVSAGVGADFGSRNAAYFIGNSYPGWKWIYNSANASIAPGDVPVWECIGCNRRTGECWTDQHIAVVTSTTPGGTYAFTVAEANGNRGTVMPDYYDVHGGFCGGPKGWLRKI